MKPLVIATRQSALALWQAEHVAERLRRAHPDLEVTLLPLSTRGDEVLDRSLSAIGGKGLFLKELEIAIADGRADLAVHSAKDMPFEMEPGFVIAALLEREDPSDALVCSSGVGLQGLPAGARVGTSSLRRRALLLEVRPDLVALDIRGNVGTRLARLDAGDFDALLLASAGLIRLGLADRISERLPVTEFVPAAGQGALAIECRADNDPLIGRLGILADAATTRCVTAERTVTRLLQANCDVALGVHCTESEEQLVLHAALDIDGVLHRVRTEGSEPVACGQRAAAALPCPP